MVGCEDVVCVVVVEFVDVSVDDVATVGEDVDAGVDVVTVNPVDVAMISPEEDERLPPPDEF